MKFEIYESQPKAVTFKEDIEIAEFTAELEKHIVELSADKKVKK